MAREKLKWTRPRIIDLTDDEAHLASGGSCKIGSIVTGSCKTGTYPGGECSTGIGRSPGMGSMPGRRSF